MNALGSLLKLCTQRCTNRTAFGSLLVHERFNRFRRDAIRHPDAFAVLVFALTAALVLLGVAAGIRSADPDQQPTIAEAIRRFDAKHYNNIVVSGYQYDADRRSLVAFFPLYPMLSSAVFAALPVSSLTALAVTSNTMLFATCLLFSRYLRERPIPASDSSASVNGDDASEGENPYRRRAVCYTLLAFGLLPTTFFFRMPYSESTFLFFAILACYAMVRKWPLLGIAAIVGITTATRPVGVALVPCFFMHLLDRSATKREAMLQAVRLLPIACGGILAYMVFQAWQFGDALAFAKTQQHWRIIPDRSFPDKVLSLASAEPVWSTYLPGTPYYWNRWGFDPSPLISLSFLNPLYFTATIALVILGANRRWLNKQELLLSALLIAIPYVTRGHEWGMLSQARFAAVVFPAYIVIGRLLSRLPAWITIPLAALSGYFLAVYAGCFASGRSFF